MELENIVANTVYLKAREGQFRFRFQFLLAALKLLFTFSQFSFNFLSHSLFSLSFFSNYLFFRASLFLVQNLLFVHEIPVHHFNRFNFNNILLFFSLILSRFTSLPYLDSNKGKSKKWKKILQLPHINQCIELKSRLGKVYFYNFLLAILKDRGDALCQ